MSVLYISYDGMTDPLGQSQVLSYLTGLSKKGIEFTLISFEKPDQFQRHNARIQNIATQNKILWVPLIYHRTPPIASTAYDLIRGWFIIKKLFSLKKYDIVHCRGYIAALLGLKTQKKWESKFIFDMRGWWADEKKESGLWDGPFFNLIYQYVKKKENDFFLKADFVVSLTEAGKRIIVEEHKIPEEKVGVVSTCVNFESFPPFERGKRDEVRSKLNFPQDARVLIYSGSLGGNYPLTLFSKLVKLFLDQKGERRCLVLTQTSHSKIVEHLEKEEISMDKILIRSVEYFEVAEYLMSGDTGLIFYQKGFSLKGRNPTKLAEYWSVGLPVLITEGIGDLDSIFAENVESGKLINPAEEVNLNEEHFLPKDDLRKLAMKYYSLDGGICFYENIYNSLLIRENKIFSANILEN